MPLVFLGCLTIFGCLFVFKVDGLIAGGQHRFPLLGPDGQASKTSSELEGQSLGGRGRNSAGRGTLATPSARGCPLGCRNSLLVLPVQLMSFLCVVQLMFFVFAWVKAGLPLALSCPHLPFLGVTPSLLCC